MFNLFKKKEENPIGDVFNDLSTNQKMSIINLLQSVAASDDEQGDLDKEMKYLNTYLKILGIKGNNCLAYFKTEGLHKMIDDLKTLSTFQKDFLVLSSYEMIACDGQPNEKELKVTLYFFEQLGISEEKYINTLKKIQGITKHFGL